MAKPVAKAEKAINSLGIVERIKRVYFFNIYLQMVKRKVFHFILEDVFHGGVRRGL
jgi:hypothetical protein